MLARNLGNFESNLCQALYTCDEFVPGAHEGNVVSPVVEIRRPGAVSERILCHLTTPPVPHSIHVVTVILAPHFDHALSCIGSGVCRKSFNPRITIMSN